jgi:hypothetical protein
VVFVCTHRVPLYFHIKSHAHEKRSKLRTVC